MTASEVEQVCKDLHSSLRETLMKHETEEPSAPKSISSSDILTVSDVAKLLKVCPETVRKMCDTGELPHRMCGNRRRIPGWLLIEWLHNSKEEGAEKYEKRAFMR